MRSEKRCRCQRFQQDFISRQFSGSADRGDPIFIVWRTRNRYMLAIGLVPVMTVKSVERDAAPFQDGEWCTADLPGMHHDGGTQFHLADVAQLNRIGETRAEQRL